MPPACLAHATLRAPQRSGYGRRQSVTRGGGGGGGAGTAQRNERQRADRAGSRRPEFSGSLGRRCIVMGVSEWSHEYQESCRSSRKCATRSRESRERARGLSLVQARSLSSSRAAALETLRGSFRRMSQAVADPPCTHCGKLREFAHLPHMASTPLDSSLNTAPVAAWAASERAESTTPPRVCPWCKHVDLTVSFCDECVAPSQPSPRRR